MVAIAVRVAVVVPPEAGGSSTVAVSACQASVTVAWVVSTRVTLAVLLDPVRCGIAAPV